jgi:hypothetical protein
MRRTRRCATWCGHARLRQWKQQLHGRYTIIDGALKSVQLAEDISAFCEARRPSMRQRSFDRISPWLAPAGVTLEGVRLDGKAPVAVRSILKPRVAVAADPDDLSLAQNCITVNYFVIGSLEQGGAHHGEGLWTLEIPDRALAWLGDSWLLGSSPPPSAILRGRRASAGHGMGAGDARDPVRTQRHALARSASLSWAAALPERC